MKSALTIILICISANILCQDIIAIKNGTRELFYESIDSVFANIEYGDSIYLPGRTYITSDTIHESVHLFGTGHYNIGPTNSTTFINKVAGKPALNINASNSTLSGIFFEANVNNNNNTGVILSISESISGVEIKDCYFARGLVFEGDHNLTQNNFIIRSIFLSQSNIINGASIYNNLFQQSVTCNNSIISNNVWIRYHQYIYELTCYDCVLTNNIFGNLYTTVTGSQIISKNNINAGVNGGGSHSGYGNILSANYNHVDSIFVNPVNSWLLNDMDYHLKPTLPFLTHGTDGTEPGLYGGPYPWKDKYIPKNPWIENAIIAPQTNSNGNLPIQITVKAQSK